MHQVILFNNSVFHCIFLIPIIDCAKQKFNAHILIEVPH